jgi:hypothetical protein
LFPQSYDSFNGCLTTNVGFTGGRVMLSLMIFGAPALIRTGFGVGMFLTASCALNLAPIVSNANNKHFISVTII